MSWGGALSPQKAERPVQSEPRKRKATTANDPRAKWVEAAFDGEIDSVRSAVEGTRNDTLNKASFALHQLVAGGHLTEGDVVRELTAAAKHCGLGESEAAATIASGAKAGKENPRHPPEPRDESEESREQDQDPGEPPAWMFDDDSRENPHEENPRETPTVEAPLKGLESLARVALIGRQRILELAAQPIDYVWADIAPPGTITVLAGAPGDGKTTLLFMVLAARANLEAPVTLLGREVRPAPPGQYIVLIEGEHSEASASRKLVKTLRLLGVDDMALERVIIVARKAVTIGSPEWLDVVRLIQAGLVSDLGIDTLARVAPSDSDSEREQVAVFDAVAQALESAPEGVPDPNCWTVAHTRKNGGTDGLAEVSGSVQRTGQADSVLLLKAERADGRVVSTRVTFAKLREDPDEYPEPVEFTIAKGPDGVPLLKCDGVSQAANVGEPLEARILTALASGPKTKSSLATLTKRSGADVEEALTALFANHSITTEMITVRGQRRKAFGLRTDTGRDTGRGGSHD